MKILFCTGGGERSENAITEGAILAGKLGAEATVISVGPSYDLLNKLLGGEFRMCNVQLSTEEAMTKNVSLYAKNGARILKKAGIKVETTTALGEVAEEILKEADKDDYSFIVVAAKGKPGDRHILGSNTRKILAKAKIPVFVV